MALEKIAKGRFSERREERAPFAIRVGACGTRTFAKFAHWDKANDYRAASFSARRSRSRPVAIPAFSPPSSPFPLRRHSRFLSAVIPAKAGIHSARPRENGGCGRRYRRPRQPRARNVSAKKKMAARPGFEPGLEDPKSSVLPLHHRAKTRAPRRDWGIALTPSRRRPPGRRGASAGSPDRS